MRRPPLPLWAPFAALLFVIALALSWPGAVHANRIAVLRSRAHGYAARAHRALLDLYSIQTELARARATRAALEAEVVRVRAQRALVQRQVTITQHAYLVSRRQLGLHLRALYETGDIDTLAVLFGSQTLDSALTNIDALDRIVAQSKSAVVQTSVTGKRLRELRLQLDRDVARLAFLEEGAARATAALEASRGRRLTLVATLQTKEQLSRRAIGVLLARARAATVKSEQLTAAAAAAPAPPPLAPDPAPATATVPTSAPSPAAGGPSASPGALAVVATGYSIHGRTATGVSTGWGVAAVDPSVIPLGTRFTVPGYGTAVAADVGSGIRGAAIDLWFPTVAAARAWGRRPVTITIRN